MTAIIIGTYNRGDLLIRSLHAYAKIGGITLVIMDDGSTDNTLDVIKEFANGDGLNIEYVNMGEKTGYRDSASFLNIGIKYALHVLKADHIFITHPEIIPGCTTIQSAVARAKNKNTWVSCKGYYLTPLHQDYMQYYKTFDAIDLKGEFYLSKSPSAEHSGDPAYLPANIEKAKVWDSWIFAGGSRAMWEYFGGLTEFETWGSVDVDLLRRRHAAGMKTVTPQRFSDYVVHQNHDNNAQRDVAKCMAALIEYETKEQALKTELLKA